MTKFNDVKEKYLERLEQYVPVVARVHGGSHPEFHEVHKLFNELKDNIKTSGSEKPDLDDTLKALRTVTNDYTVPKDVCESYEAVYQMLSELDKAY